jgi:hypothetical protein
MHQALDRLLFSFVFSVGMLWFLGDASTAANGGPNSDAILVRSQLPLPGGPVQQMFLRDSGGRNYLYISQAGQADYVVVHVTDDRHPTIIKEVALPHGAERETLEMVGAGLGVAGRPDSASQSSPAIQEISGNPPGQFIRLLDLSDPSHPRTLKTFNGVTSVVLDDRHNMIYLTNGDGLWILHHRIDQMRQICEDESKYQPVPMMCTGD